MKPTLLALLFVAVQQSAVLGIEPVRFNRDVRPILSDRCFLCHGTDIQESGLRLDHRDSAAVKGFEAGDADGSELIKRVTSLDADLAMPPARSHKPRLTPQEVDILRQWIDQGAEYEEHWAFLAPESHPLPPTNGSKWTASEIDHFVLAKLVQNGLTTADDADKRTLIRRVTLDLTGLPPTPSEVEAFVADRSAIAYEKVVDRLLASPRFGEHRARFWLDVARYADTNGYQYDLEREQWVWRDWVIHAFNSNMPYDRFTTLQIAGDLLPDATAEARLATGFQRNHPITIEGGVIDEEYRTEYVMDRVATTSTAWLGLTFQCARCHDHKFDPLTQRDFYSMFAFFNNVPEKGLNGFDPKEKIASPLADQRIGQLNQALAQVDRDLESKIFGVPEQEFESWEQQLAELQGSWQQVRATSLSTENETTLRQLDDDSISASGKNPDQETYKIAFRTGDAAIRGLRIEVLTDSLLAGGSVGRAPNGNFVLSEVVLSEVAADQLKPIKIASAEADYQQQGFPAEAVFDGETATGGWAVDGNQRALPSTLIITLDNPIAKQTDVVVTLLHNFGTSHAMGRFRLSTIGPHRPLPLEVLQLRELSRNGNNVEAQREYRRAVASRFGNRTIKGLFAQRDNLLSQLASVNRDIPATLVMKELAKPRQTFVLERGEYDKPIKDQPVSPDVPSVLGVWPDDAPRNRLGLAIWITDQRNPLMARVTVNRFWAQLFGRGLVSTPEDFGSQGAYPSHPDLLAWLAVEFVDSGWDVKQLFKTIVMSRTYRQSSVVSPDMIASDPDNRLLTRGPRFRLDAEAIRDSALAASGLLDDRIGGPSLFPYHPHGLWQEINNRPGFSRVYPHSIAADQLYRRSMYTFWKRTVVPPSLATFDAPEREYCVVSRSRTNTPLQAFVLLHDPQFVEAARKLAKRMLVEGGDSLDSQIAYGFQLSVARSPNVREADTLRAAFNQSHGDFQNDTTSAHKLLSVGESPRDESLDIATHAAMTNVARLILNLSEFVTKD